MMIVGILPMAAMAEGEAWLTELPATADGQAATATMTGSLYDGAELLWRVDAPAGTQTVTIAPDGISGQWYWSCGENNGYLWGSANSQAMQGEWPQGLSFDSESGVVSFDMTKYTAPLEDNEDFEDGVNYEAFGVTKGEGTQNYIYLEDEDGERFLVVCINVAEAEAPSGYLADLRVEDTSGMVSYLTGFDSETKEYTVTVPSTETKVAIGAKLSDNAPDGSKITLKYVQTTGDAIERELEPSDSGGDIIKKLIAANTTGANVTVEVGVEGDIQTYSVTIERSTPQTGYLADLRVEDTSGMVSYLTGFDSETKEYTITVPTTESKLSIGALLSDKAPEGSTITLKYMTGPAAMPMETSQELTSDASGGTIISNLIKANENGASFTVEVGVEGDIQTYSVTIERVAPPAELNPVIITQPVAETTCDKGDVVTLSVAADETLGQNLSYQWYKNMSASELNMIIIQGATEKTYTVPTDYAHVNQYQCKVTNTADDGQTYTTESEKATVTVNLTYVNDPTVEIYSGGTGTYYEFGSPGAFQIRATASDVISFNNITVQLYCTDTDAAEGGEMVWEDVPGVMSPPVSYDTAYTGGAAPSEGKPAGTYYYYATVSMDYEGVTYSAVSETKEITYLPYSELVGDALEGSGTAEDPFRIKTLADLEYIQAMVNRAGKTPDMVMPKETGYSFEGVNFKVEADIELPADWEPIGSLKPYKNDPEQGKMINPFSGNFDGNGHKISVAEGGKPLFGYVRKATVKNLEIYGPKIAGNGLIDNYVVDYGPDGTYSTGVPATATIENVTILSGTQTLSSGLISGDASARNIIIIKDCTVEENVVIGYDTDSPRSGIGSFAGAFNGSISGCVSYATVNGQKYVGGLMGRKGESMGPCSVSNCEFYGTVNATGEYVGGIVGGGYNASSAPNAPCVSIEDCKVDATVIGANKVGGIFGGEGGVVQAWDNGIGYIRNNEFRGTVTATAENGIVGGDIGFMMSLNINNVIEDNYYSSTCGADKGIGAVLIVDTDIVSDTPAWNDDHTVLYINSGVDDHVVDDEAVREITGITLPQIQYKYNRSDDPLGADAEKLCYSDERETATLTLDANGGKINGRDTYTIKFDASMSGQALPEPTAPNNTVEFKGWFEGQKPYSTYPETIMDITLVAQWSEITGEIPPEETVSVSFRLIGSTRASGDVDIANDDTKGAEYVTWIATKPYTLPAGSTVADLIVRACNDAGLTQSNALGGYVASVTAPASYGGYTLSEFTNGPRSGWMYTIGESGTQHPGRGVAEKVLSDGDVVILHYVNDYAWEVEDWAAMGGNQWPSLYGDDTQYLNGWMQAPDEDPPASEEPVTPTPGTNPAPAKPVFEDVPEDAWFAEAVAWAVENGITTGTSETTFEPDLDCTRGQVVTFLWRAAGEPKASAANPFTDVAEDSFYYDAVLWAVENGITTGVSATEFAPDAPCTRAQVVTFMWRAAGKPASNAVNPFGDVAADAWYYDAVLWAVGEGVTTGTTATTFEPDLNCTRAQVVTFMWREAK